MKKKLTGILTVTVLAAFVLTGCGGGGTSAPAVSGAEESKDGGFEEAPAARTETTGAKAGATGTRDDMSKEESGTTGAETKPDISSVRVGVIYAGDETDGDTFAHMKGVRAMALALDLPDENLIEMTNVPEDAGCYDAVAGLAEKGCDIIFANRFSHETCMLQAAEEYPGVQFCHAGGYQAAISGLPNMHNFFTAVYESRYVSGVVAGLKLNEMIENEEIGEDEAVMGYVGSFPFAEVISGYTGFYLGARSVCPSVTMKVRYTNSRADPEAEGEVARGLIADGCVLLSQHTCTTGAPAVCQELGVPCVGYLVSMTDAAPDVALTSATTDWSVCYAYAVQCLLDGTAIEADRVYGYPDGANGITELNGNAVAEGTKEAVAGIEAQLKDGTLHVFDTSTFTVGGRTMEELIEKNDDYMWYADFVSDGCFHESETESAPSFDLIIDGITSRE